MKQHSAHPVWRRRVLEKVDKRKRELSFGEIVAETFCGSILDTNL
jgi:hypothetical protein